MGVEGGGFTASRLVETFGVIRVNEDEWGSRRCKLAQCNSHNVALVLGHLLIFVNVVECDMCEPLEPKLDEPFLSSAMRGGSCSCIESRHLTGSDRGQAQARVRAGLWKCCG